MSSRPRKVALDVNDEHGEEVGEVEQRQHQLGIRPGLTTPSVAKQEDEAWTGGQQAGVKVTPDATGFKDLTACTGNARATAELQRRP